MIYSAQSKVLFCRISRTGGTSVSDCLQRSMPDAHQLLGLDQHEFLESARTTLGVEAFENAFKFAFVRNPWDRFVSWYAMIARATLVNHHCLERLADPVNDHWNSFDSFLDNWSGETVQIDGVPRPKLSQSAQLSDAGGKILTDEIGRFESLAEDIVRLFARIGIECPEIPRINTSVHHHYSAYYSDYGRELVAEIFKEDVERFGYQFENNGEALISKT